MSFGQNLQFLRKMQENMTQEQLAEKMNVSRQTISKWEMDAAFPEMDKAIALSRLFACSLDELLLSNLNSYNDAYTNMRVETVPAFQYVRYAVISADPEGDAQTHMLKWAANNEIANPDIIGWDFPFLSQEQINVYHMHGYTAACVFPQDFIGDCANAISQTDQKYAAITIRNPFAAAFMLIPNSYKTLMRYMSTNGLQHKEAKDILPCFERVYELDGVTYMDVFIASE